MRAWGPLARRFAAPAAAAGLLLAVCALRFVFPDARGIMLLAVVPIAALGAMFGVRGGLAAALLASAAYLGWAGLEGDEAVLDYINHPVTFFSLGFLSGQFARGALGDYDLQRASANARLGVALAQGEVELHYQPIVGTHGRRLLAVEGLARWRRADGGLLHPDAFIPDAERDATTIWHLTLHTLEVAARDALRWPGEEDTPVTVNLAPSVLARPELPDSVERILRRAGLPASRLVLEITERAVASSDTSIAEGMARIGRLGLAAVAIDDFGTGQSSLARLDRLPVDWLKVDRYLVGRLDRPETQAIMKTVADLSHALGLTVIAEGVEDLKAEPLLTSLGYDAIQGFVVSEPIPRDRVSDWIQGV